MEIGGKREIEWMGRTVRFRGPRGLERVRWITTAQQIYESDEDIGQRIEALLVDIGEAAFVSVADVTVDGAEIMDLDEPAEALREHAPEALFSIGEALLSQLHSAAEEVRSTEPDPPESIPKSLPTSEANSALEGRTLAAG